MMEGGTKEFWIKLQGKSMFPFFHHQDQILIKSVHFSEVEIGDILLFIDQNSHELTVHRLIEFPMVTKGDFSLSQEQNPIENFLGKAIAYQRGKSLYLIKKCKWCNFFSMMRTKGRLQRLTGLVAMMMVVIFLRFCNARTKLDHNTELHSDDLSSHV